MSHDDEFYFDDGEKISIESNIYDDLVAKTYGNANKICTLIEFLQVCKEHKFLAFIELKPEFSLSQCEELINLI